MQRTLRSLVSRCAAAAAHQAGAATETALGEASLGRLAPSTSASTSFNPVASISTASSALRLTVYGPHTAWWRREQASPADALPSTSYPTTSSHEALPPSVRLYAKGAATGGGGGAGAGSAAPKRYRTSMSKLYSCRNDRLRHTHEQIWPTLKLTEPELAMFQRNSRKFVVDMGKVVTLQTKFRMNSMDPAQAAEQAKDTWTVAAKRYDASARDSTQEAKDAVAVPGVVARAAAARKVPYQQARTLLNEVQLHLDALGENPRYLRLRQLGSMHATKLQNVRKVRLLLGFQRRRFVQRMYEHALVSRGHHRMWKLVTAMESTLPVFATRLGLVDDVVAGARAVQHKKLYLNGRHPDMPYKGYLVPGDVVGPSAGSTPYFQKRIIKSLEPLEGDIMRSCIGFT